MASFHNWRRSSQSRLVICTSFPLCFLDLYNSTGRCFAGCFTTDSSRSHDTSGDFLGLVVKSSPPMANATDRILPADSSSGLKLHLSKNQS
ncbi:hypothetical protein PCANC_01170 [Puccinia coronata f. sp. avenae]|uniref:Uncharacterized protein n=1 Tax=Puccinia coronata f. sp. avenae TaxID=200324 RepID=A0A2N5W5Q9_9BASI|nr:hypothetical protein PCANC_01170 [Puccinia coronata f. sp. avenae]